MWGRHRRACAPGTVPDSWPRTYYVRVFQLWCREAIIENGVDETVGGTRRACNQKMLILMWSSNAVYPNFADACIAIKVHEKTDQGGIEMEKH